MSAPARGPRDVIGVRVEDSQALLTNITDTVPRMQFMREIPYNGIQACQRALTAGAPSGLVVVDYVDAPFAVRKLRFWDTGDGMSRADLFHRLVSLSAAARTEHNFGVGAKLALAKVSPHGAVYISLRDGHAYLARMQRNSAGEWGMAVLDPTAATDIGRSVVPAPDGLLPEEIVRAGHGTVVVLLGQHETDRTVTSLQPEGKASMWWVVDALNERFTQFPDHIEVRVIVPDADKAEDGSLKDRTQTVLGSAGHLRYYTRDAKGASDPVSGARGKVRINGPVPATAYWWVLPAGRTPSSYMRIGGKVRVVVSDEAYQTAGVRYLSAAGVWHSTSRVEIHFVPDAQADARPDLQRSSLKVDGRDLPVLEWCEEFRRNQPTAVKNLMAGAQKSRASSDFTAEIGELYSRMVAGRRRARRSSRGSHTGVADGTVSRFAPTLPGRSGHGAGSRSSGTSRRTVTGQHTPTTGREGQDSGEVVELTTAPGANRRLVRAVPAAPALPTLYWANENDMSDDAELGVLAARFDADSNHLVLNCQNPTYQSLVAWWVDRCKDTPGSKEYVTRQVREYFALNIVDAVVGAQREYPRDWRALVTPEALTVRAAGIYHIDTRLKQVFHRMFKDGASVTELEVAAEVA